MYRRVATSLDVNTILSLINAAMQAQGFLPTCNRIAHFTPIRSGVKIIFYLLINSDLLKITDKAT